MAETLFHLVADTDLDPKIEVFDGNRDDLFILRQSVLIDINDINFQLKAAQEALTFTTLAIPAAFAEFALTFTAKSALLAEKLLLSSYKKSGDVALDLTVAAAKELLSLKGFWDTISSDDSSFYEKMFAVFKSSIKYFSKIADDLNPVIKYISKTIGPGSDIIAYAIDLKAIIERYNASVKEFEEAIERNREAVSELTDKKQTLEASLAKIDQLLAQDEGDLSFVGGDTSLLLNESGVPADQLSGSGTLQFFDQDFSDKHGSSVSPIGSTLGTLVPKVVSESFGSTGTLSWTYSVDAAAVEYLSLSQVLEEKFTITLTDSSGATVSTVVTVSIRGTNDAPVISADSDLSGTVHAGSTTASGTIIFSDVDATDQPAASAVLLGGDNPIGTLQMLPNGSWTYTIDPSNLDDLTSDVTETYRVTVEDDHLGVATADLAITISPDDGPPGDTLYEIVIATNPTLLDANGDGSFSEVIRDSEESFENLYYPNQTTYYTYDLGDALSNTEYEIVYDTEDFDVIIFGPPVSFGDWTGPAWVIVGWNNGSSEPEEGWLPIASASEIYAIANATTIAPELGASYFVTVTDYEYSESLGVYVEDTFTFYASSPGSIDSRVWGPDVIIPGLDPETTYPDWVIAVDPNTDPYEQVPDGWNVEPSADHALSLV